MIFGWQRATWYFIKWSFSLVMVCTMNWVYFLDWLVLVTPVSFTARSASELEPLQPWLRRCIGFLTGEENKEMEPVNEISRPRAKMDHITVWLGLKALYVPIWPSIFVDDNLLRIKLVCLWVILFSKILGLGSSLLFQLIMSSFWLFEGLLFWNPQH